MSSNILPRLIRLRDAPGYLGMDPNRFNEEVRAYLIEIPIGKQGIGFDRLDLDAWFEDFKNRNGRSGKAAKGGKPWDAKRHRASSTEVFSIPFTPCKSRTVPLVFKKWGHFGDTRNAYVLSQES